MTLRLISGDITDQKCDAIVNAANEYLREGGGVCGAIFNAAGSLRLRLACQRIGHCPTGQAVITSGFDLCKYIIHAVGPVYIDGRHNEEKLLRSCYRSSLQLAKTNGISSIAFPVISSGIYGYPKDEAIRIALEEIQDFLKDNEMEVRLVFYGRKSFLTVSELFENVEQFLEGHYVEPVQERKMYSSNYLPTFGRPFSEEAVVPAAREKKADRKLEDLVENLDETFTEMLFRLIDEKGYDDVETYKRANIDRKLFSKIKSNRTYRPSRNTVMAFCIALRLSLDEAKDLLSKAGYALSHSNRADVIVEYFIENRIYDIFEVNEALFYFTGSTL